MAYTRTDWKDGTTPIDATNMNKIEDGIAANADDISSLNDDLANCDILGNLGTAISSGDDLNDYTTAGKYRATTSAIVSSLENCPTTAVFVLYVFNLGDTRYDAQLLFANSNECYIYYRVLRSAGWTSWYRIGGTAISTSSVGDPVVMEEAD